MDTGILLLRLTVGLALAAHGAQKLFGWFGGYGPDGTGQFMETIGFHPGRRHAIAAGAVEVVGGLLLAFGFLTPLGAALIASVMIVAVATVHGKNGFFITSGGYEFNLVIGAAVLSIAFTGPGAISVDAIAGYAKGGVVWGVGAAVVAIVGAISQLAQRRELPTGDRTQPAAVAAGSH